MDDWTVTTASGTLRAPGAPTQPHRWTDGGVTVDAPFTGAHLLHLAVAGCVLNDVHREAAARGLALGGVRVTATGGFDTADWRSTGIRYRVEVDSALPQDVLDALLTQVDAVAEIPRVLRAAAEVQRDPT